MIARKLVPNLRLTPSYYVITAANRMDLPILKDANLSFTFDGHKFKANVSILHDVDEFLLGVTGLPPMVQNGILPRGL